jgi:hypothetical protein
MSQNKRLVTFGGMCALIGALSGFLTTLGVVTARARAFAADVAQDAVRPVRDDYAAHKARSDALLPEMMDAKEMLYRLDARLDRIEGNQHAVCQKTGARCTFAPTE